MADRRTLLLRAVELVEPVEAPAAALRSAAGAVCRGVLSARDGKLRADRHARARYDRPHHPRQPGLLPDDRLGRGRPGAQERPVPLLAARQLSGNATTR